MWNKPVILDARRLYGDLDQRHAFAEELREIAYHAGFFYLSAHGIPEALCTQALEQARLFFELPEAEKQQINIKTSPHFRGYSQMRNSRDWREQIHFGREEIASESNAPNYRQLQGPNLWPASLGEAWKAAMLTYLDAMEDLGRRVLGALALGLGLQENYFDALSTQPPYLLMKLICYHPQSADQPARMGVAPHCDWSWITFLHQDSTGGLQVQNRAGEWLDCPPVPGTFSVNLGELIEIATQGYYQATPHRVINRSIDRPRISIPIFINPSLDGRVQAAPIRETLHTLNGRIPTQEHVHRVSNPDQPMHNFIFGDSEWERKGLGRWCYHADCAGN
jgi:isopenicillin N synthase-like dioxygenase